MFSIAQPTYRQESARVEPLGSPKFSLAAGDNGRQTIVDAGSLPPHPGMDPTAKTNMEDIEVKLVLSR